MDRRIDNVKPLTPWWGIASLTKLDSDQKAAEALQEAETAVGLAVTVVIGAKGATRASGSSYRSATR